ncbi:hypothetical protein D043_2882B, partial [Vibrio parahaemolyticus EKP-021]
SDKKKPRVRNAHSGFET